MTQPKKKYLNTIFELDIPKPNLRVNELEAPTNLNLDQTKTRKTLK